MGCGDSIPAYVITKGKVGRIYLEKWGEVSILKRGAGADSNEMPPFAFGMIMAEIQDINKFLDDGHLASYAGQAPKLFQSGSMNDTRSKRRYNRHLAHLIHQLACNNVIKGRKFYNDYTEAKKRYNKKLRAIKHIKRKMVRLLSYGLKEYSEYRQKNQVKKEILYAT